MRTCEACLLVFGSTCGKAEGGKTRTASKCHKQVSDAIISWDFNQMILDEGMLSWEGQKPKPGG
jgi:hypothetical protein